MSELTTKSEFNAASAIELERLTYYCSSIHCSYYSCIQLMMHVILYKIGYDQKKLKENFGEFKEANPKVTGGLHAYYINLVAVHLKKSNLDFITFNKEIFKLKKTRNDSDYLDISVGYDECRFAIQRATEINKIIKKAV